MALRRMAGTVALAGALLLGLLVATPAPPAGAATTEGTLYVDTKALDFGPTTRGVESAPKTVTITNIGGAPVEDLRFTIEPGFRMQTSGCPSTLQPGASCSVTVTFKSEVDGVIKSSFFVQIGVGTAQLITLRGVVANNAFPLRVSPTRLVFEDRLGATIPPQAVTVTNITAAPVTLSIAPDPVAFPYAVSSGCGGGTPFTLAPGATCSVQYSVPAPDTYHHTEYTKIVVTGSVNRSFPVLLEGGANAGTQELRISPQWFDFGDVPLGTSSPSQPMVVTNITAAPVTVNVSGVEASGPFGASTTCGPGNVVLAPGASCTVDRTFSPTIVGPAIHEDQLWVQVVGGSSRSVSTKSTGYGRGASPYLTASRSGVEFRATKTGIVTNQTVTVRNDGSATATAVTVQAPVAPFGLVSEDCTDLAPGATCSIVYSYTGSPSGPSGASSLITGGPHSTVVNLRAAATPDAPSAAADTYDAIYDRPLVVSSAAAGLFANDRGSSLRSHGFNQPAHGSVTVAADGTFTYVPDEGFAGTDQFTYTVADVVGATSTTTVTIRMVTPSAAFVRAAYTDFLDRLPITSELNATRSALDAGTTNRRAVLTKLATSDEWIGVMVDRMYQDTLGRSGDPAGVAFWVRQLRTGRRTVAQAAAEFYASGEYYRRVGGTDQAWVADLYPKLLGRPADPSGLAYWVGQTASKGRPRVAARFFQSAENRRQRVGRLYQQLLGRAPDSGGLEYWSGRIETEGDIALAIELAASDEYLRRAQDRFP